MIERSSVKPLQFLLQPACASFKRRADLMAHQYYLGEPAASVLSNKGRLNWRPFPREISMEHGSAQPDASRMSLRTFTVPHLRGPSSDPSVAAISSQFSTVQFTRFIQPWELMHV
jgi:hypothetical protein